MYIHSNARFFYSIKKEKKMVKTLSTVPKRIMAIILGIALILALLPASSYAATDSVNSLDISGFGTVYYVVDPSDVEAASGGEEEHAHIKLPNGSTQDAYFIDHTDVAYYTSQSIPETFYGSSSMTWLEFWANEGLTQSTLTDASSAIRDSEAGEGGTGAGYYDLGGFDAVTRPTVRYGLSHFRFQYNMMLNGINLDDLAHPDTVKVPLVYRAIPNEEETALDAVLVTSEALTSFTAGTDSAENPSTFVSYGKEYELENYDVEGFQRIPVSVNGESYIENKILLAAGQNAPEAFDNFTIGGSDGANQIVTAETGGIKVLDADGSYGKAAAGKSIDGYDLESRGGVNTPGVDYNTSWGDYADAYALVQKTTDDETADGTKTTLSAYEWAKYSNQFLAAKYEYFGTSITDDHGVAIAKDDVTVDSVATKIPLATYGTLPGADTWYSPAKKSGGRIELGFQFDSLRLGGDGTNTEDKGIYSRGSAADKTGYYKVTLYAAGFNDVSKMVYIAKQLPAPKLTVSEDSSKLILGDFDSELKTAFSAGTANAKLQSVSGRDVTDIKDFTGITPDASDSYDVSDVDFVPGTTYRLTITSTDYPNIVSTYVAPIYPESVSISKAEITLSVGDSDTLEASITPEAVTAGGSITWSSNKTAIATVDAATGKVTAKAAGTAIITATTGNGKTATCTVTVKPQPSIKLNKTAATLYVKGKTVTLAPTVVGDSQTVAWKSSNTAVATVDSKGVVTAKKAGTATITATANGVSATCKVTVKAPTTKLNKTAATIYTKGVTKVTLAATVVGDSKTVAWKSSNTKIATVSAKGVVTAKKAGTATISATANGVTAKTKITVKAPTLKLAKSSATISKGKTVTIKPTATPKATISYTSSNKKVATVTSKGVVKGIKKGTAKITVKANGVSKVFTVTVK
jgi:uncharacterized protein YjdB